MAEPSMNEAYKSLQVKHKALLESQADLHQKIYDLENNIKHLKATNSGLQRRLRELQKIVDND